MSKKAQLIDPTPDNQLELEAENMPAQSPIGKAARAFLKVCDEIDDAQEALKQKKEAAKKKVLDLMAQENREAVRVDRKVFRKVHISESDELRVYGAKKEKKKSDEEQD